MMNCKEYIFKLTSGQFEQAPIGLKLQAALHRMVCKYCRAFTENDKQLTQMLASYKAHMTEKRPGER